MIITFSGTRDNSDSSNYTGAGTDGDETHDQKRIEFYEVRMKHTLINCLKLTGIVSQDYEVCFWYS
jgi:hypothetical protein